MNQSTSVTVAIDGGLGNQMFQYAAARALAARCDAGLVLDLSFYNDKRHRRFELDAFPIEISGVSGEGSDGIGRRLSRWIAGGPGGAVYREPHFHYDPAFEALSAPVRLEGYFPSPRYFAGYEAIIRRELAPPAAEDAESQRLAPLIGSEDAISLHVRRGDYVSRPKINRLMGTCSLAYYEAALARFRATAPCSCFQTTSPGRRPTCRRHDRWSSSAKGRHAPGIADLWLMTLARHHVIANSSFSWWGAWLARRQDGVTIAPTPWFASSAHDETDLLPADWTRLPT